jgi:transcriptional regulator with XRE-family HTH domain
MTEESARAILKDWVAGAWLAGRSHTPLHEQAGIDRRRLSMMASAKRKEAPTPDELARLSAATGYPAHEHAVAASVLLKSRGANGTLTPDPPDECTITSRQALKAWIKAARKTGRSGRLTQGCLAARVGVSQASVTGWESPSFSRIPKSKHIKSIAAACGVPEPVIAFDIRVHDSDAVDEDSDGGVAGTLDEEILQTGRRLSRRSHALTLVERNAQVFRARYGGSGDDESTLQAIGVVHGVTRERIRQIVDKQLSFLHNIAVQSGCFDALASACAGLEAITVSAAEESLRHLLGDTLSLQGASDYGREVLGRPLPIQLIRIPGGDMIVMPGDLPPWFQAAITQSKAMIGHCGAAQFNLAWALTMRHHQDWITPDQFRQVLAHAPGFEWIDDDETWFWFGHEGSANRLVKRAIEIVAFAKRPLDIEIIYGGLTRYIRARDSGVSEDAGVWPPMDVVQKLLAKSPALVCQQGDDFRLASPWNESDSKQGVAETILGELTLLGGLASRSELYQALVVGRRMNPVSFSVALANSPLLRQLDRSVFAIRGWPISAARLTEAQHRVGSLNGARINFKEVDFTSNGDVSWVNILSKSSVSNMYAGVPRKATIHLTDGQYTAGDAVLTLTESRVVGLIRIVVAKGGVDGTLYRTTLNARTRMAKVVLIGEEDLDDDDPE